MTKRPDTPATSKTRPVQHAAGKANRTPASSRYATFAVELLMNAKAVQRTHVTHVQSGRQWVWSGWNEARMLTTLARGIGLARPRPPRHPRKIAEQIETGTIDRAEIKSSGNTRLSSAPIPFRIQQLQVLTIDQTASHSLPTQVLMNKQAFQIRMGLDLTRQEEVTTAPQYRFHAFVQAKNLTKGGRMILCEREGDVSFASDGSASIEFDGALLEPGTYRLTASVVLQLANASEKHSMPSTATLIEGKLLHIY